jgi:N-acetylneuraminic acid mutarotase
MDTAPLTCEAHGQPTRISCVDCAKPLCPKCLVRTAVGIKCKACAKPVEAPRAAKAVAKARRRSRLGWLLSGVGAALVLAVVAVILVVVVAGSGTTSPARPGGPPLGTWKSLPAVDGIQGTAAVVTLPDGRVLAAGGGVNAIPLASCAIYDPQSGTWKPTGSLDQARRGADAVVLRNGDVLLAGGIAGSHLLSSAELYNPAAGRWELTGSMSIGRLGNTLTLLPDGEVLAAGGTTTSGTHGTGGGQAITPTATAEIYNPATGKWRPTGSMMSSRFDGTATRLSNGQVLVAGGLGGPGTPAQGGGLQFEPLRSAEIYNPSVGVFTSTGQMSAGRAGQVAVALRSGEVLVAGGLGADGSTALATAEVFNPSVGIWTSVGTMAQPRDGAAAVLLDNGDVLVIGGQEVSQGTQASLASAEVFDPTKGSWRSAGSMTCPRSGLGAARLPNGDVIAVAGDEASPGQAPLAQSCVDLYVPAKAQ